MQFDHEDEDTGVPVSDTFDLVVARNSKAKVIHKYTLGDCST
jgi:hypothetical protein